MSFEVNALTLNLYAVPGLSGPLQKPNKWSLESHVSPPTVNTSTVELRNGLYCSAACVHCRPVGRVM